MASQENASGDGPVINMEVASLVGRVTIDTKDANGKPVTLLLDNFGFDDWSAVQERFLKKRRASVIQAAVDAGKAIVESEEFSSDKAKIEAASTAKMLREEAMTVASRMTGITLHDFVEMTNNDSWSAVFLWVMIERRYPGKFSISDVERMLRDDDIDESICKAIVESLFTAMGIAGNSPSQGK